MRGVDLDGVEAGAHGPARWRRRRPGRRRRISSSARAAGSSYPSKGTSDGATVVQPPSSSGTDAGPRVPGPVGRRLAARVGELDADRAPWRVHEVHDPAPGLGLLVVPDPGVLRGDPALGRDRRGLGEDQPEPAGRAGAEVHQVPVVGDAVGRGVLAHRRQPDAVARGHRAQRDRLEQLRQGSSPPGSVLVRGTPRRPLLFPEPDLRSPGSQRDSEQPLERGEVLGVGAPHRRATSRARRCPRSRRARRGCAASSASRPRRRPRRCRSSPSETAPVRCA